MCVYQLSHGELIVETAVTSLQQSLTTLAGLCVAGDTVTRGTDVILQFEVTVILNGFQTESAYPKG